MVESLRSSNPSSLSLEATADVSLELDEFWDAAASTDQEPASASDDSSVSNNTSPSLSGFEAHCTSNERQSNFPVPLEGHVSSPCVPENSLSEILSLVRVLRRLDYSETSAQPSPSPRPNREAAEPRRGISGLFYWAHGMDNFFVNVDALTGARPSTPKKTVVFLHVSIPSTSSNLCCPMDATGVYGAVAFARPWSGPGNCQTRCWSSELHIVSQRDTQLYQGQLGDLVGCDCVHGVTTYSYLPEEALGQCRDLNSSMSIIEPSDLIVG